MVALAEVPPCTGAQATGETEGLGDDAGRGEGDGVGDGEDAGVGVGVDSADVEAPGLGDEAGPPPGETEPQATSKTVRAASAETFTFQGSNGAPKAHRVLSRFPFGTFGPRPKPARKGW